MPLSMPGSKLSAWHVNKHPVSGEYVLSNSEPLKTYFGESHFFAQNAAMASHFPQSKRPSPDLGDPVSAASRTVSLPQPLPHTPSFTPPQGPPLFALDIL